MSADRPPRGTLLTVDLHKELREAIEESVAVGLILQLRSSNKFEGHFWPARLQMFVERSPHRVVNQVAANVEC